MSNDTYKRVKECPICGKARCLVSEDGTVACCWRVIDGSFKIGKNGMGVHKLDGKRRIEGSPLKQRDDAPVDHEYWDRYIRRSQMAYSCTRHKLGESLGLSEDALVKLGVGILDAKTLVSEMRTSCKGGYAWTFPMYNEHRRPIGIRLRSTGGFKYAADGSHNGMFIPKGMPKRVQHLYVVEGPTDTAAALDYGVEAIGRPMNIGVTDLIVQTVLHFSPAWVTIVIDRDKPGSPANEATWRGAHELKSALPVSVDVLIAQPPGTAKDLRAALIAGRERNESPKEWVFR